MAILTLRNVKGSPLTNQEADDNLANLNAELNTKQATLGTGVQTFLTTPTSANFAAILTDETGTGNNVFATSPTLVTPILGTPTSGVLTNCTDAVGYGLKSATTTVSVSAATAPTVGQVLTATTGTTATWQTAGGASFNSRIVAGGGNGYGSTNTKIRRFMSTSVQLGTDITYADSVSLGSSFTINTTGLYSIYTMDRSTAGNAQLGVTLNTTYPTGFPGNGVALQILILTVSGAASARACASRVVKLTAGDVVRAHTDGLFDGVGAETVAFEIMRVG